MMEKREPFKMPSAIMRSRPALLFFLPALVFLWFIGWSLYWIGKLENDLNSFPKALRAPTALRSLDYLMSYVALFTGMGYEGNPLMAYLIGINPLIMLVGFVILSANILLLVKMYPRHKRTVTFCYYLIIASSVVLIARNLVYGALWLSTASG